MHVSYNQHLYLYSKHTKAHMQSLHSSVRIRVYVYLCWRGNSPFSTSHLTQSSHQDVSMANTGSTWLSVYMWISKEKNRSFQQAVTGKLCFYLFFLYLCTPPNCSNICFLLYLKLVLMIGNCWRPHLFIYQQGLLVTFLAKTWQEKQWRKRWRDFCDTERHQGTKK